MTPQPYTKKTILAIFPSSKGFGYALMESPTTPVDYAMVSIKRFKLNNYKNRIRALLGFFKPTVVIVENHLYRKGKRVKAVVSTVYKEAARHHLKVYAYSREDIRNFFKSFGAFTKYEIASFIASEIPELKDKLGAERKIWASEQYHMPIFDSISLAMTYYSNT